MGFTGGSSAEANLISLHQNLVRMRAVNLCVSVVNGIAKSEGRLPVMSVEFFKTIGVSEEDAKVLASRSGGRGGGYNSDDFSSVMSSIKIAEKSLRLIDSEVFRIGNFLVKADSEAGFYFASSISSIDCGVGSDTDMMAFKLDEESGFYVLPITEISQKIMRRAAEEQRLTVVYF